MIETLATQDRSNTPANGIQGTPLSISALLQFHNSVASEFQKIWREGEKNEGRWVGDNWTESQRAKIRRQRRQAYSLAILASKLRYISATQKQLRTSYRVEPTSDPNDEIKAELATIQMKAVENRSNAKYTDSDTFDAGLAIKYGVKRVGLDRDSIIPRVKSYTVDWKNFVWDLNSREYDIKKDGLWCAEVEKFPRYYLESIYGKDAISNIAGGNNGTAFNGRNKLNYYINFQKSPSEPLPLDNISLFKHCQKVSRPYYYVLFADQANIHKLNSPVVGKYKTKKEADEILRQLNLTNLLSGLPQEGEVIEREEVRIDYYEFTYNKILYYEQTEWEMFPYDVYFSIRFEDKFCSFQDFLNDPQLIIDRMWAQIDYSMGKDIKNVYQGNRMALDSTETPESAERKASQTGGIIWTKTNEKVFEAIESQGTNPQWVNAIEAMIHYLEEMTGGATFKGTQESKAPQSGKAIRSLQQAGSVMASAFLDSFNRFKKAHGENILWWIREYETEEDTRRVLGGQLTPEMRQLLSVEDLFAPSKRNDGSGFVTVNKGGISYLKDAEIELTIQEEGLTETMREKRNLQLKDAVQSDPLLAQSPTFQKLYLESMDIGYSDKQKLIQERQEIQQKQDQLAQAQLQMESAKNNLQYGKDALDQVEQVANIKKSQSEMLSNIPAEVQS